LHQTTLNLEYFQTSGLSQLSGFPDRNQGFIRQNGHLSEVQAKWLCSTASQTHTNVTRNGSKTTGNSKKLLKTTLPSAVHFDAA